MRVGEGAETLVVFLSGGIPESEADGLAINHDTGRVVVEAVRARRIRCECGLGDGGGRAATGTNTVGMYSPGKAFVVYEMRRHVWEAN